VLLLRGLLRDGLYEFEQSVDHVVQKSGCGCALQGVLQSRKRYDFGAEKCSRVSNCEIVQFLDSHRSNLNDILEHLVNLPAEALTNELVNARDFIQEFLDKPDEIRQRDPCLSVGDLLIAIESAGIPTFYTMNGKESQHICRPMQQNLIVRPANPSGVDIECDSAKSDWPRF
jgi:hypothetical protein